MRKLFFLFLFLFLSRQRHASTVLFLPKREWMREAGGKSLQTSKNRRQAGRQRSSAQLFPATTSFPPTPPLLLLLLFLTSKNSTQNPSPTLTPTRPNTSTHRHSQQSPSRPPPPPDSDVQSPIEKAKAKATEKRPARPRLAILAIGHPSAPHSTPKNLSLFHLTNSKK